MGGGAMGAGRFGGRTGDPDEALERLPAIRVADVAKDDEIAVLGPRQAQGQAIPAIKAAVWTMPQMPASAEGRSGVRGPGMGAMGGGDAFSDMLGMAGGETSW
jgi:hypothetical protein